jgi:hypothetical protein
MNPPISSSRIGRTFGPSLRIGGDGHALLVKGLVP